MNVCREVLTFPRWVRDSHNVMFAMKVYAAFNSNNYVRFFRLVRYLQPHHLPKPTSKLDFYFRNSTYLEACILHRYLTQVIDIRLYKFLILFFLSFFILSDACGSITDYGEGILYSKTVDVVSVVRLCKSARI